MAISVDTGVSVQNEAPVRTTDATSTELLRWTPELDSASVVLLSVNGTATSGDRLASQHLYQVKRNLDGCTVTSMAAEDRHESGSAGWTVDLSADGDDAVCDVVGEAAHDVTWQGLVTHRIQARGAVITPEFVETIKVIASDQASGDAFGTSVGVSGDTAIVGAPGGDDGGYQSGHAYVYGRDHGGADNWGEVVKIVALDDEAGDGFGTSVAISGDTAAVGAPNEDGAGANRGAVYMRGRDVGGADNWGEIGKLTASDTADSDYFGYSVALDDVTMVVGAYGDGGGAGSAYVFDGTGGVWSQTAKIVASDPAALDYFGWSVAVSGTTVVVGAPNEDGAGSNRGAAYVYDRDLGGGYTWGQRIKLTASDAANDDAFGYSVAISGDVIVVGAQSEDGAGTDRGAAYVFERNSGGTDAWGQTAKLTASDTANGDQFGFSVAIDGNTILVGAKTEDGAGDTRGAVYVFERHTGALWGQRTKLIASDAANNDVFGSAVSIDAHTAISGAPGDADAGAVTGSAYVFDR